MNGINVNNNSINVSNNEETETKTETKTETETSVVVDEDIKKIINFWENNIGLITQFEKEVLEGYLETMNSDLIMLAIKKAVASKVKTLKYIEGILKNWKNKNIKTVLEAEQEDEAFKNRNTETKKVGKNSFNNYEQREYENFDELYANNRFYKDKNREGEKL